MDLDRFLQVPPSSPRIFGRFQTERFSVMFRDEMSNFDFESSLAQNVSTFLYNRRLQNTNGKNFFATSISNSFEMKKFWCWCCCSKKRTLPQTPVSGNIFSHINTLDQIQHEDQFRPSNCLKMFRVGSWRLYNITKDFNSFHNKSIYH